MKAGDALTLDIVWVYVCNVSNHVSKRELLHILIRFCSTENAIRCTRRPTACILVLLRRVNIKDIVSDLTKWLKVE